MSATGRKNYIHTAYSLAVTVAGLGLLIGLAGGLDLDRFREFAVLILMGVLVEWLAVNFPLGRLSGSFSILLGSLLIYNLSASAWISSVAFLAGNGVANRGNSIRTSVFNMAQQVLALFGSVFLIRLAWGRDTNVLIWSGAGGVFQLLAFIILFFVINHLLVYLYTYPGRKESRLHTWQDTLRWDMLSYLFSAPFGIIMAVLYQKTGILLPLLLFVPILTVQFILRLYVRSELVNKELRAVYEITGRLGSGNSLDEMPGVLLKEMRRAISFHSGVIYIWRENKRHFCAAAAFGPYKSQLEKGIITPGEGFWGWVINNGEPEIVFDSKIDPRVKSEQGLPQVLRSLLAVPLTGEAGPLGLAIIGEKKAMSFAEQDLHVAVSLCGSLSTALSNRVLADRLEKCSRIDRLTGLLNRDSFLHSAIATFEEAAASGGKIALAVIDLDIMGHINEGWGHDTGNKMIVDLARLINTLEVPGIIAGRYGDDEFALLLPGFDEQGALDVAGAIREGLSEYSFSKEYPLLRIKVSMGIADGAGEDFDQLLKRAGLALQRAKKNGRDRICIASDLKGRYTGKDSWLT